MLWGHLLDVNRTIVWLVILITFDFCHVVVVLSGSLFIDDRILRHMCRLIRKVLLPLYFGKSLFFFLWLRRVMVVWENRKSTFLVRFPLSTFSLFSTQFFTIDASIYNSFLTDSPRRVGKFLHRPSGFRFRVMGTSDPLNFIDVSSRGILCFHILFTIMVIVSIIIILIVNT